ncbi:MAG: DUF1801 domain-containing protein [Anaerolineae bacterium]|nr:DUF1801 domain-containing protein [Anaerolineae bacterium]
MTTFDDFLSTYTPPVQELALKTRELVLSLFPDALEQVDVPGKLLGYGTAATYAGTVCVIMPLKDSVNLGFARGASLPDPAYKLQGTGKNARHIKFRSPDEIDDPAVRALLQAAIDLVR